MAHVLGSISRRKAFVSLAAASIVPSVAARAMAGMDAGRPAGRDEARNGSGFHRFAIGAFEAIAINDGGMVVSPIQPTFAPEATPEELTAALAKAFHPLDRASLEINVLCVRMGKETVLFDTGNGPAAANRLIPNLSAAGIEPSTVTAVVLSHAHPDHIAGGLDASGKPAFANARWIVNKAEHDFWTGPSPAAPDFALGADAMRGMAAGAQKVFAAIKGKMELVKGGDKVLNGLELIDTPGHTAGHTSAIISSGSDQLAAMGDLAHNHVVMFANPAWTIGFDSDKKAAVASRVKMFDRLAADRVRVFGYHMPWPGLGHVRKDGAGFEWVIEPWAWTAK